MKYFNSKGNEITKSEFYAKVKQLGDTSQLVCSTGVTGTRERFKRLLH